MDRKLGGLIAAALLVSGCAWKSGVLEMGPNTYQVSANAAPARGGITAARKLALTQAGQKCAQDGRQIVVLDVESEYSFPANGVATVTFRCD